MKSGALVFRLSSFIHSFITEIYIEPLQGYYSEALPTLARLKRRVLRLEKNVSERILGSNLCDKGSLFHTEGPTTENARAWVVGVRAKGTKNNPCSDERSELRPLVPGVGQQRSRRQDTPPDHGTNTEHDPLLEGQPVEYIKHVGRYVSSSKNAAYEARGSADNVLEAAQTHSRETNVECGTVIKPRCDKGVDKSSSSSGSESARDDT